MGVIEKLMSLVFGGGRNALKETAEVFFENAEGAATREALLRADALAQFAAEFAMPRKRWFDALMDGLNRLPRPLMALGTIGLFVSAMTDPIWFAARMQGIALVPEPLWWILGAVISFYFGARHQVKGQEFQAQMAQSLTQAQNVVRNLAALESGALTPTQADAGTDAALALEATELADNIALNDWQAEARAGR